MGEIEGDGDSGDALWGKPFVAKVAIRLEGDAARGEFGVKLLDARFEFAAFDAEIEIAEAEGEQFVVFEGGPGRGWIGRAHGYRLKRGR